MATFPREIAREFIFLYGRSETEAKMINFPFLPPVTVLASFRKRSRYASNLLWMKFKLARELSINYSILSHGSELTKSNSNPFNKYFQEKKKKKKEKSNRDRFKSKRLQRNQKDRINLKKTWSKLIRISLKKKKILTYNEIILNETIELDQPLLLLNF